MLFYLTDSLIVPKTDPRFSGIRTAIYHLAVQVAEGNHAVIGDIDSISYFREMFKDDFVAGPLFNKIYQNIAFEVVPSFIKYYVEVVLSAPASRFQDDKKIVQVEYDRLIPLETTNKTSLVCEFLYDAEFYGFILKWYTRRLGVNVHCTFNVIDGGGGNTYMNIDKELKAGHITISILDTDYRYPVANNDPVPDSTYDQGIGIGDGNVLYNLLPLYVHELENLVPLNYVDQEFAEWTNHDAEYATKKVAFDYLKKDAENILPFYDFKKGIKYNDDYRATPELQNFAKKCYELNDDKMALQPDFDAFVGGLANKAYIYPELIGGTGTIKMALKVINSGTVLEPDLYEFQRSNWEHIGSDMLNWCFSRKPEAIH